MTFTFVVVVVLVVRIARDIRVDLDFSPPRCPASSREGLLSSSPLPYRTLRPIVAIFAVAHRIFIVLVVDAGVFVFLIKLGIVISVLLFGM